MKLIFITAVFLVVLIGQLVAETLTEDAEVDSPVHNIVKRTGHGYGGYGYGGYKQPVPKRYQNYGYHYKKGYYRKKHGYGYGGYAKKKPIKPYGRYAKKKSYYYRKAKIYGGGENWSG